jgi:hypothetical protein
MSIPRGFIPAKTQNNYTELTAGNIKISENVVKSVNTNGNITLEPNGTGKTRISNQLDLVRADQNGIHLMNQYGMGSGRLYLAGLKIRLTEMSKYNYLEIDNGGGITLASKENSDIILEAHGTGNVNVTSGNLKINGIIRLTSAGGVIVEANSSSNRPASPLTGQIYFDTDIGKMIVYNGSTWVNMDGTSL